MTKKIDHLAEAKKVATEVETTHFMIREEYVDEAQLHATIAIAEQMKRIADWLEEWPLGSRGEPMTGSWTE